MNIMLVANEAGLSAALGTMEKERKMRASLVRAMELSGDNSLNKIIHSRRHMQQWGAKVLAKDDAIQEGLYEPKQFGSKEYQAARSRGSLHLCRCCTH